MWTSSSRTLSSSTSCSSSPSPYKSMEEVWKDISLASDFTGHPSSRGVILQDFFSKDPPPPPVAAPSPPPPPPPVLSLSSLLLQPRQYEHVSSLNNGGGEVRKRLPEEFERSSGGGGGVGGGDRRHKRMIKNRESAARSRARKQAYTNELEVEVAHLIEENARLKEQQEQLYRAAAAQHQQRKPLHRTLTCPF